MEDKNLSPRSLFFKRYDVIILMVILIGVVGFYLTLEINHNLKAQQDIQKIQLKTIEQLNDYPQVNAFIPNDLSDYDLNTFALLTNTANTQVYLGTVKNDYYENGNRILNVINITVVVKREKIETITLQRIENKGYQYHTDAENTLILELN